MFPCAQLANFGPLRRQQLFVIPSPLIGFAFLRRYKRKSPMCSLLRLASSLSVMFLGVGNPLPSIAEQSHILPSLLLMALSITSMFFLLRMERL